MGDRLHGRLHPLAALPTGQSGADDRQPLRNPLRNERDAFRLLAQIVIGALVVVAAAALLGRSAALILTVALLGIGGWRAAMWLRAWLAMPEEERHRSTR